MPAYHFRRPKIYKYEIEDFVFDEKQSTKNYSYYLSYDNLFLLTISNNSNWFCDIYEFKTSKVFELDTYYLDWRFKNHIHGKIKLQEMVDVLNKIFVHKTMFFRAKRKTLEPLGFDLVHRWNKVEYSFGAKVHYVHKIL